MYLTNQNKDQRPGEIASEFTYNALGRNVPIIYARRVGKTSDVQNRRVLIRFKHYNDVHEFIQSPSNGNIVEFQHFRDTKDSAMEMVHKNFLKKSLNISKHASNTCIYKDLKRSPVTHRAWAMVIKYWIRLNSGTETCLLNEAYKRSQAENHQWLQIIHYLLNMHGFSDIWSKPSVPGDTFHKAFKSRADDLFNQSMIGKLQSSSIFTTLEEISDNRGHMSYILIIRSPRIRNIFLRLRIGMNILSTSRSSRNILSTYPLCSREPETVKHFILKCCRFAGERDNFIDYITSYTPLFRMKDDVYQLKYILGLHCPLKAISYCCKYISSIYSLRENDEIQIHRNL